MLQQCLPLAVLKLCKTKHFLHNVYMLQQCLPLAVLKRSKCSLLYTAECVATVLTACGIETTIMVLNPINKLSWVATVLTACGIETYFDQCI